MKKITRLPMHGLICTSYLSKKVLDLNLKMEGYLIIPGKFLNNKQLADVRKLFRTDYSVDIVKINDKVFEEAQVDSVIVTNSFTNKDQKGVYRSLQLRQNSLEIISKTSIDSITKNEDSVFKIEINESAENLISKIENNSFKVKEIGEVKDGIEAGKIKDILFINKPIDKSSKTLYFSKHLSKYNVLDTQIW